MAVMALGSAQVAKFMIIVMLMLAGVFVIAVVTPKLAAFIDKKRGKAPDYSQIPKAPISPFESAPLPERVEESTNYIDNSKPNMTASSKVEESTNYNDSSKLNIPASSKVEESINYNDSSKPDIPASSKVEESTNYIDSSKPNALDSSKTEDN